MAATQGLGQDRVSSPHGHVLFSRGSPGESHTNTEKTKREVSEVTEDPKRKRRGQREVGGECRRW